MCKRQVWVDLLVAEAKDWHGLRRFRFRGLEQVNCEALLIAAGLTLKRWLSWRGWGRRPFPRGAAGSSCRRSQPCPCRVNQLWTQIETQQGSDEVGSSGNCASRNAGTTAQVERRLGTIDSHRLYILVRHALKGEVLPSRLEPFGDDFENRCG
jgi:hypothetical protein